MFELKSEITIDGKKFGGVNNVVIKRSVNELGATATVKVPVTAVLRQKDGPATETETAKAIKVGDPVLIRLGYNDTCNTEFRGYVKQLNYCTPLEIVCEDAFYPCRKKSVTMSGKTTLAAVLQKCGLSVGKAATLALESFQVPNKPVAWVLAKLKKDYGLAIFFDMDGRVYASEPGRMQGDAVRYVLQENVVSADELKYQKAGDVKIRIRAVCIYRDGSRVEGTVGADDGTEKTLYFYDVKDQAELKTLAQAELKRRSYDGYSGRIQTFLLPYAAPGMLAEVTDRVYPDRDGRYYIESVETTFGTSGARRQVEIGIKV